jgi:hypothetical protein
VAGFFRIMNRSCGFTIVAKWWEVEYLKMYVCVCCIFSHFVSKAHLLKILNFLKKKKKKKKDVPYFDVVTLLVFNLGNEMF